MIHQGTQVIETERLLLRPFTAEDVAPAYRNWTSDAQVTRFLRWPTHANIGVTERVIGDWLKEYARPDFYQWAIVPHSVGEPIGTISVVDIRENVNVLHMGYCIGSRWWHQGYTSEALRGVMRFLFTQVGANRIEAWHDPENPHSGDVMRKCGMTYEGTLRQADISNRGIVDACVYALLRRDAQDLL